MNPYSPSVASSTISNTEYGAESSTSRLSPLRSMESDLLKGLGASSQKLNRDGQPSKRRGPKPDSKPAQTRRQELNRQAQRNHREKKENHVRVLEEQNEQLKDAYLESIRERDAILAENHRLKSLLDANGIDYQTTRQNSISSIAPSFADHPLSVPVGHGGGSVRLGGSAVAYGQNQHQPLSSTSPVPSIGLSPGPSYYPTGSLTPHQQNQSHNQSPPQPQAAYTPYDTTGVDLLATVSQEQFSQIRRTQSLSHGYNYEQQHRQHGQQQHQQQH